VRLGAATAHATQPSNCRKRKRPSCGAWAGPVRDWELPHQLAGDDAVRLARALAYVLDTLEARRREGKSLLGLDETVRMLVDGLKARGAEFR
jgi:hypothetical protein